MSHQRIALVFLVCLIAGSNSQAPACSDPNQQLMNVVVFEGNSSSFFNQPDPAGITWQIAPSYDSSGSPSPPYLVADNGVTPYPDVYTVAPTQLDIPRASIFNNRSTVDPYSTSGLYQVTYGTDGCVAMANLIVVSKGPDCLCTPTGPDTADLTCGIEVGVTRILPNYPAMTWTTGSGNEVYYEEPTPNVDNSNYDVVVSTYQITSSGAASYACKVGFKAPDPGAPPDMATNAPTFTASCTVANCVMKTTITSIGPTTNTPTSKPLPPYGPACSDPNQQLMNTVVYEGNSSSFFNQPDTNGVSWQLSPSYDSSGSPNPPYPVANGGTTPYPGVYVVTPTRLDIPKTSIYPQANDPYSTSGLYQVTYGTDGCVAMANLIVVSKGPDCQCIMIDPDNAQLSCQMEYGIARILPNNATMTWTTDSGDTVASDTPQPNQDPPNYDISTSAYQVTSSGAASYTCGVIFKAPDPGAPPNMATNAPTFTASCTVANCVKMTTTNSIETTTTTTAVASTTTPIGCPKDLVNIVVNEGSVAEFENVDDGKPVKWHFSSSSDPENNLLDITDYDNKVNPMFVGAYNVTRTKLTILSATVAPTGSNPYSAAGVYFLSYQSTGCQTAANLIVIHSGPVCDRNENDPNNVMLTCNISYAESERQPSYPTMTWTTEGVFIPSDQPTTQKYEYVNESLSQIPVDNTAPSYYQCQVTFNPPAPVAFPIPFLAQNAPSYIGSCTVASGTFPPTTEIATTTVDTVPPTTTTGVATTTEVCVDSPNCSSKWSDRRAFCPYVQEFRNDCAASCGVCNGG